MLLCDVEMDEWMDGWIDGWMDGWMVPCCCKTWLEEDEEILFSVGSLQDLALKLMFVTPRCFQGL